MVYDALSMYEETKQFELYLLVRNRILSECQQDLQATLLQKLDNSYKADEDIMNVLKMIKN